MMKENENGKAGRLVGYDEALQFVYESTAALPPIQRLLREANGQVLFENVTARVDSPPADISAMDGYAVLSADIESACEETPIALTVAGKATAGKAWRAPVQPGTAVNITTGAPIPEGADAVVPVEMCRRHGEKKVEVLAALETGRYIRTRGADTRAGRIIAKKGSALVPSLVGHLAAAGVERVNVVKRPSVSLLAIGDEIVEPGEKPGPNQIFASNTVCLAAWLARFGFTCSSRIVRDDISVIADAIDEASSSSDTVLSVGGAGDSDRDLVVPALDTLGWNMLFRRVRLRPGSGSALGLLHSKPVFCLPGGPPACEMVFLQLVLPGLWRLAGHGGRALPEVSARLKETIALRDTTCTGFHRATLVREGSEFVASPYRSSIRLERMSRANSLIRCPEGMREIEKGTFVEVQMLDWHE
ncbi:MAG: molybdopterin molybdotransferase MoeA [Deltaproteobacteria bacterium]|nr:molybdopterin molybdotransferase MoeA [Deltaproteobacteria bacterium]